MNYIIYFLILIISIVLLEEIFNLDSLPALITSIFLVLFISIYIENKKKSKINKSIKKSKIKNIENEISQAPIKEKDDPHEDVNIYNPKPRKGTEAYRVEKEVKKIKQIAESKKVKELVTELYFDEIKYYPSWIKHENREHVPSIITEANEKPSTKSKFNNISEIVLNGQKYTFKFKSSSYSPLGDNYFTIGTLELHTNKKKVLSISLSENSNDYYSSWRPTDIDAFIDGNWINEFEKLKKQIIKDKKIRGLKKAEDKDKVNEMKKNFGIE